MSLRNKTIAEALREGKQRLRSAGKEPGFLGRGGRQLGHIGYRIPLVFIGGHKHSPHEFYLYA